MGFIREIHNDNHAALIVAFRGDENTFDYTSTNDVEEALRYFNLYVANGQIYVKTKEKMALEVVGLNDEDASEFRNKIDNLLSTMDDTAAIDNTILFPLWRAGITYKTGDRIRYEGVLYKVLNDHTSQEDWLPTITPSLYAKVLNDGDQIVDWEQPDSTNGYNVGDIVRYDGHVYRSLIDNNVWSPSVYPQGWALQE